MRPKAIMAKLVHSKCPNCGAAINVDPGAKSATCEYCGQLARVQRKTMFGRAAVPLDVAAGAPKVIHVPNAAGRIVLVVTIVTFVIVGVVVFMVVNAVKKATDSYSVKTGSGDTIKMNSSGKGYSVTLKQGDTTITVNDGKVVANLPEGTFPGLSGTSGTRVVVALPFFEHPNVPKAKFLSVIAKDARATSFILYDTHARLEVLDGRTVRRYHIIAGEVSERGTRRVSKSQLRRLKTFSLASMDVEPVKKMIAKTKAALSGTGANVSHLILDKNRRGKLEWRVYGRSSDDQKMLRFNAKGKAIRR